MRLAFWSAWPAAPLTRLSIAAAQIAVCVRSSIQTPTSTALAPCRQPGCGVCVDRDERLGVVARAVERLGVGLRERLAQPRVARDLEAARVRREVRRERDGQRLAGEPRERALDLGDVAVAGRAVRLHAAVAPRSGACFSVGSRPAPETPDLPSIATGASSRPGLGERREREDRRGRVAAGVRDLRASRRRRVASELGQAVGPAGVEPEVGAEIDDGRADVRERLAERRGSRRAAGTGRRCRSARAPRRRARRSPRSGPGAGRP